MLAPDPRRAPAALETPEDRPLALIVDDDPISRMTLRKHIERCGYEVVLSANGREGLERFAERRPDIVFMDLVMPEMDGLEATRRIKALTAGSFVPVIFVSGSTDANDALLGVSAGADDFVTKPYSQAALEAKIHAMDRIRRTYRSVGELLERERQGQALAEQIFSGAIMGANCRPPALAAHIEPADTFNGDILLSGYTPAGDIHVLLGDFTGHGLAAAIGALPAAEVFRAMTAKGFAPQQILEELNAKLRRILPTGHFLACALLRVERDCRHFAVFNCGLPEVMLYAGSDLMASFSSNAPPLAVLGDFDYAQARVTFPVPASGRIVIASDGATEAMDSSGTPFGVHALRRAIARGIDAGSVVQAVAGEITRFRDGAPIADDVSFVVLELSERLFAAEAPAAQARPAGNAGPRGADTALWRLAIELRGDALKDIDPIPMVSSFVKDLPGFADHAPSLSVVLSELYNNALDHGVLMLDSRLKERDFASYLHERDRRLADVPQGRIALGLTGHSSGTDARLSLEVEDSGNGFSERGVRTPESAAPHGRGIALVRALSDSLTFSGGGNRASCEFPARADGKGGA